MINLSKAISHKRYKIRSGLQLMTRPRPIGDEFTGITFKDHDPSGTRRPISN